MPIEKLHFITKAPTTEEVVQQVTAFCKAGGRWVQLRMKNADYSYICDTAFKVKEVCRAFDAQLIINDYVEIARTINADGVHLGQEDCPPEEARAYLGEQAIIGHTINCEKDLSPSALQNIDYLGVGPYRQTATKENLKPILGLDSYDKLLHSTKLTELPRPVIAVGGIRFADIPQLIQVGVHGCAISSAITQASNPGHTTQQILNQFHKNNDYGSG